MSIVKLAGKSIANRRVTALLTIFSIAISVMLLLGVERVRVEAKQGFTNTISGTDLIVGARGGDVNLLLYSVFHIGDATNNISWESYQAIATNPVVEWTIPIALGDSHRGFRVMGTASAIFEHFRYQGDRKLALIKGKPFADLYDVVIGADVAQSLGYVIGEEIVLSHGMDEVALRDHKDKPFNVSGILDKTGTPMDRVVMISLEGINALHIDWLGGAPPIPGLEMSRDQVKAMDLTPESITATYVGLKSRIAAFRLQREINEYPEEALQAVMPGMALQKLWGLVGTGEKALLAISALVVLAGLTGMLTSILTSLNERRREMAILRSVGARPWHIFFLLLAEALLYAVAGSLLGLLMLYGLLFVLQPILHSMLGMQFVIGWPGRFELMMLGAVIVLAVLMGIAPAWRAYRHSLADGLTIRV